MRVACELCAAVSEATARVDGAALAITCGACGGTFTAPLAASTAPSPKAAGPVCPKCEAPSTGDGPCPRCGLSPAHAEIWLARHAIPPTASLGAAWDAAVAAWSDDSAHDRAAAIATETGDYAWLAARYRATLRERPDDAIARRHLDRLARRAEATLRATAAPPPQQRARSARIPYVVLIAAGVVVAGGLLYARHVIQERKTPTHGGHVERIAPLPSRR